MRLDELDTWVLNSLAKDVGAKSILIVGELDLAGLFPDAERIDTVFKALPEFGPVNLIVFMPGVSEGVDDLIGRVSHFWKLLVPGGAVAFVHATSDAAVCGALKPLFGSADGCLGDREVILGTRSRDELRRDGGRAYDRSTVYIVAKESESTPELVAV